MSEWKSFLEKFSNIKNAIDFSKEIHKYNLELLKKIFFGEEVKTESKFIETFAVDFLIETNTMILLCDLIFGFERLESAWQEQIPIIADQLSELKSKKKIKFLIIIEDFKKELQTEKLTPRYPNILIVRLKDLLLIKDYFIDTKKDFLNLLNNFIEFGEGFLYNDFIVKYLNLLNEIEELELESFIKSLNKFLVGINTTLLNINKESFLDKYNISIRFQDVKLMLLEWFFIKNERIIEDFKEISEYPYDIIKLNFDYLRQQKKIVCKEGFYILSDEISIFNQIFNDIFNSNDNELILKLFLSDYFSNFFLENDLIKNILNRFYILKANDIQYEEIKKICSIFPSALYYCLNETDDLIFFKNISKDEKLRSYDAFKFKLFAKLTNDYFNRTKIIHSIFKAKEILDERFVGNFLLLKHNKLYLDFNVQSQISQIKYVGKTPLEPGTPVTLVDKKGFVEAIGKFILLKDYNNAVRISKEYINNPKLGEIKHLILINLGVAYAYLGKFTKAIECYENALKKKEKLPLIYKNIIHAWFLKYKQTVDNQKEFPLDILNMLIYLDKAKNALDIFKSLELNKEEKENFNDIKPIEKDIRVELKNFLEQSLIKMNYLQIPEFLIRIGYIDNLYLKEIYKIHKRLIDSFIQKNFLEFSPLMWNNIANFYRFIDNNEAALLAIENGLKSMEQNRNSYLLFDTKAEILYNLNNYDESFKTFSKILELNKDDPRVSYFYAETCWKAAKCAKKIGNIAEFNNLYKKAKELLESHCLDEKIKEEIKKG